MKAIMKMMMKVMLYGMGTVCGHLPEFSLIYVS